MSDDHIHWCIKNTDRIHGGRKKPLRTLNPGANLLPLIKSIYKKFTANILLGGEKLYASQDWKQGKKASHSVVVEVLANATR